MAGTPHVLAIALSPCVDRYLWFERLELGVVNRPTRVEARPGGKMMNAARVLRALDVRVAVVAPLDPSEWGWWVERSAGEGIEVRPCPVTGTARMTMTCIDETARRATEIYEPGPPLAPGEWRELEAAVLAALGGPDRPTAAAVAGSRPGDDDGTLARIVAAGEAAGVPVHVDGYGPAVEGALAARPAVLKVNLEEARRILRADAGLDGGEAARALVAAGPRVAIVTLGAGGAVAHDGERLHRVPPPAAASPFPGGSGDAFFAGVLAGRVRGLDLPDALELARRCAEANATAPYAGWVPGGLPRSGS
jgi:tagatose 6-phosphate kinase